MWFRFYSRTPTTKFNWDCIIKYLDWIFYKKIDTLGKKRDLMIIMYKTRGIPMYASLNLLPRHPHQHSDCT